MRHTRALVALLLLTTLMMPVRADPGGTDAPDEWGLAEPLAPGNHSGVVGPSSVDGRDWYAIAHGPGEGVRVIAVAPRAVQIGFAVAGQPSPLPPYDGPLLNATHWRLDHTVAGDGVVHVGFRTGAASPQGYTFDIEVVPIGDIAVREIWVTEASTCPACGDATSPFHLRVHVRLANAGLLPHASRLAVWVEGYGHGTYDTVAGQDLVLSPGAEVVLTYEWRASGAGNLTFLARSLSSDPAFWNDRAKVTHVIGADVPGVVVFAPTVS